jgi:hypothetical protein
MNIPKKSPVLLVAAAFALTGCNLLDVDNPNSLTEESIQLEAAANGVANGSLRLVSDAIADIWEGPAVVADELYWTGSRDAWGQLDNGYIADPFNEFTDAAFPSLGEAVWTAQNAVDILTEHVANNAGVDSFAKDLARAQLFNGMILMVTGELQEDMTFSDKMEDGPPVGPGGMSAVLDRAIDNLTAAVDGFAALDEDDLETQARAVRARAYMSRTIWDELNPTATAGGAIAFASALADANAVLTVAAGADWKYSLTYASGGAFCDMCDNVNNRGENQWDASLVELTGPGASGRTGNVTLLDPVSGDPDPVVADVLDAFGDNQYADLTIASARLMHLIVAEDALANGDTGTFETHINAIRAFDSQADFTSGGAVSDVDILQHTRRVNTLFMGLRLQDMYRWGLTDPLWQAGSQAANAPGTMLPITVIECRANRYLTGNCETVSGS